MNVGIHQPDYIPWLGLFYKMYLSDVFIHLDDVQYSNTAAHNFNVIKTAQGELRLKFPVEYHLGDMICEVRPKYELGWREKHLRTLEMNYSKARFFKDTFSELKDIYMVDYPNVAELNIAINEYIATRFGITSKFVRSSEFAIDTKREEKVIDLCVAVGGTRYISGNGARVYQDPEQMSLILNRLRSLGQRYSPDVDPEVLSGPTISIRLIYSDGTRLEHQIKPDRYIRTGQAKWQQTDPKQIQSLMLLLKKTNAFY